MKTKVLLVDESLTVQKVVALTLDKNSHEIRYAKSRAEALKAVGDFAPNLILVSEQVGDIDNKEFPQAVQAASRPPSPPLILITTLETGNAPGYQAILKKPFSPQSLQNIVSENATPVKPSTPPAPAPSAQPASREMSEEFEAQRLENVFNQTFSDEATLVQETLEPTSPPTAFQPQPQPQPSLQVVSHPPVPSPTTPQSGWERKTLFETKPPVASPTSPLWETSELKPTQTQPQFPPPNTAHAPHLPTPPPPQGLFHPPQVPAPPKPPSNNTQNPSNLAPPVHKPAPSQTKLNEEKIESSVRELLEEIVPPIVERLVREKLDALLKEADTDPLADIKP